MANSRDLLGQTLAFLRDRTWYPRSDNSRYRFMASIDDAQASSTIVLVGEDAERRMLQALSQYADPYSNSIRTMPAVTVVGPVMRPFAALMMALFQSIDSIDSITDLYPEDTWGSDRSRPLTSYRDAVTVGIASYMPRDDYFAGLDPESRLVEMERATRSMQTLTKNFVRYLDGFFVQRRILPLLVVPIIDVMYQSPQLLNDVIQCARLLSHPRVVFVLAAENRFFSESDLSRASRVLRLDSVASARVAEPSREPEREPEPKKVKEPEPTPTKVEMKPTKKPTKKAEPDLVQLRKLEMIKRADAGEAVDIRRATTMEELDAIEPYLKPLPKKEPDIGPAVRGPTKTTFTKSDGTRGNEYERGYAG